MSAAGSCSQTRRHGSGGLATMSAEITRLDNVRKQLTSEASEPLSEAFIDTDLANARRFGLRHGENMRFTTAAGWLVWNGTKWDEDAKGVRVQALAADTA